MAKSKTETHDDEAPEAAVPEAVERRHTSRMTDAEMKAWIRKEIDLHAAGVDHNERELQNP